jgi:hypothetical protein
VFNNKLTADPKEHIRRANTLLNQNDNSVLLYAALELRFATERIMYNQLSLSEDATKNALNNNDPKRKKLIMNKIDPESDADFKIYLWDGTERILFGIYKSIPESKIKSIEGRLGNLLHMKLGLNLGIENDPWYRETRSFLTESASYLSERITDSLYYFSYKDVPNFELEKM